MIFQPEQLTLPEWDDHYVSLKLDGLSEPAYGGKLSRHAADGDLRLCKLRFDNSTAALNLWNFLLTEEERLHSARSSGKKIVGTMKDLGTIPVMAYSLPDLVAFYPDGAWWIPCIMELSAGLLDIADSMGVDESFCPVRAMLGAFASKAHFPIPDILICSTGATCDDFSAIAQRLEGMGHHIEWWEIPHRRAASASERSIDLPGGFTAPEQQVRFVQAELERIRKMLSKLANEDLTDSKLSVGIKQTNLFRKQLAELRELAFTAELCPMPALELLIAEMISIHFCSDPREALKVVQDLLNEVKTRVQNKAGYFDNCTVRIFWVNPVADIRVMNLLEECGGRICGTEYMFSHALDQIPMDIPPMEALARSALADPMAGTVSDRAERVCRDIKLFKAEALIISRIPGASHCALESDVISDIVSRKLNIPVLEIEVPPVSESIEPSLRTKIEALIETIKERQTEN